jgi:hypothetical protein
MIPWEKEPCVLLDHADVCMSAGEKGLYVLLGDDDHIRMFPWEKALCVLSGDEDFRMLPWERGP